MTEIGGSPSRLSRQVTVHLPGEPRLARLARTVAAAYGSVLGLSVDELDDVRLLVDEVFHTLLLVGTGPVTLRLTADARLEVEVSAARAADTPAGADMEADTAADIEMARRIATVVTEDFSFTVDATRVVFRAVVAAG